MTVSRKTAGSVLIIAITLAAVAGPWLVSQDPMAQSLSATLRPPGPESALGTDHLGRSVLSRVLAGGRYSLAIAGTCTMVSLAMGTLLGVAAGYFRGWADLGVMRLVDAALAFPGTLLAIVLAGTLGGSFVTLVLALSATLWCDYCRLARNLTRSLTAAGHVRAGTLIGFSRQFMIRRYILPVLMPQLFTLASLNLGRTILNIAGLGFLGIGLRPPLPEWGSMINQGITYLSEAPWLVAAPGMMIFLTVFACQLLAGKSLPEQEGTLS